MLQRDRKSLLTKLLALVAISTFLFSFSEKTGGDSFEIYLNDKLVLQQYLHKDADVKSLALGDASGKDVVRIHYSHCGKTGTSRTITIKDERYQVLKEWKFADGPDGSSPGMTFKVKDILAVQKIKGSKSNVYYSAKLLPEGRLLASFITQETKASLK